jgi:hypothetical protein
MAGQTSPVNLTIGLLAGNFVYLMSTLVLSMILGVAPVDLFSGPFSGAANSLVSGWVAIGALLGVTDVLAVVGFVSSVLDATW